MGKLPRGRQPWGELICQSPLLPCKLAETLEQLRRNLSVKYNLELCFWLFFFGNWFIFLLGNCVSNSVIGTLTLYSATVRAGFEGWFFWCLFGVESRFR